MKKTIKTLKLKKPIKNIKTKMAKKIKKQIIKKKSSSLLTQSNVKELLLNKEQLKIKLAGSSSRSDKKSDVFFDNLISVEELAVIFRLAPQTIRNWVALRKIPYVKLGRRHFFQQGSLKRWLNQKEEPLWQ